MDYSLSIPTQIQITVIKCTIVYLIWKYLVQSRKNAEIDSSGMWIELNLILITIGNMTHIENYNNLLLRNIERFEKHYPNIKELAWLSNLRIEIAREFKTI